MKLPTEELKTLLVREFMATSVMSFTPDMPMSDAVRTLVKYKYSGAPVVDAEGRVVGMLSEKDCLVAAVLAARQGSAEAFVGDCMSSTVEAVEPDTSLLDVAERFAEAEFKRFPVVADGFLVGQISRFDVLRAVDQLLQE
jgi:CBS domain-containing protein